jgi:hypothetical protein
VHKLISGLFLLIILGTSLPSVKAADQRTLWDINQLSDIRDPNLIRAVFGYFPNRSINDDYSFTVTIPDPKPYQLFRVVLSPCSELKNYDLNYGACIENVASRKIGSNSWSKASISTVSLGEPTVTIKKGADLIVGQPVTADALTLRPPGDRATIWTMPETPHSNGNSYLVRAVIAHPGADNISYIDGGLQRLFSMEILPISFSQIGSMITQDQFKVEEFPNGYEYKLRLRLGVFIKSISGWFFGRLQDPTIERNGPEGYLEVSGTPARVPVGTTDIIRKSDIPQKYLDKCPVVGSCYWTANTFNKAAFYSALDGTNPDVLSDFEQVKGGVKTVSTLTHWEITSSRLSEVSTPSSNYKECTDKLYGPGARVFMGAVSSNATLYQTTPPQWDELNKAFTFKVSSPRLDEYGKPNKGFYTLYIPLDQANCRWGINASAPQAQIQIVNQDGTSTITTTVAMKEHGMLRFNVAGFGYSAPTIRIRMGQGNFIASPPLQESKTFTAKKTVLICIKGKTAKQVIGVRPKCPLGYRQWK